MKELLNQVKANMTIEHDEDDRLIQMYINAAVAYAEAFQHHPDGFYKSEPIPDTTRQAVIMLATHYYESRDGSGAGFFGDNPAAAQQVQSAVNNLLRMEREWKV